MWLAGVKLAIRSLRRNILRTILTILGILIGVSSVVFVTALIDGARTAVTAQLQSVGPNLMFIFPQSTLGSGTRKKIARLSEDDARAIEREANSVAHVATTLYSRALVIFRDNNVTTTIVGVNLPYFTVHAWDVSEGAVWTEQDAALGARVCVLGATAREHLFGNGEAVGQTIRLGRYPYQVIGTLAGKGSSFGNDGDDQILVPIAGARARIARTNPGFVSGISVLATSSDTVDRATEQIRGILRQRHKIPEGGESDFDIRSMRDIQRLEGTIYAILTVLLVTIAGISLVVGGIGVMNIMLVSVTERTREIGIRMAIGARSRDIQTQFLVEAVVLALLGGLSGLFFGAVAAEGVGLVLGWKMHPRLLVVLISVGVSALIGIGFGYFPARRAARLDPMTALRYE